ncbi:hypothetical protein EDB84DRAFT_135275 [Lactarius hengduanensis]|nr:hypothetical protein EDB84DRAFT_135275 [Lactarius hengduanensis]
MARFFFFFFFFEPIYSAAVLSTRTVSASMKRAEVMKRWGEMARFPAFDLGSVSIRRVSPTIVSILIMFSQGRKHSHMTRVYIRDLESTP